MTSCDPSPVPPLLDLVVQMLPSDTSALHNSAASATEAAKWSELWYLGKHAMATLRAAELSHGMHVGGHLSAYDLSALSVGVYRALLRVSASNLHLAAPCLVGLLLASQLYLYCCGWDTQSDC